MAKVNVANLVVKQHTTTEVLDYTILGLRRIANDMENSRELFGYIEVLTALNNKLTVPKRTE